MTQVRVERFAINALYVSCCGILQGL